MILKNGGASTVILTTRFRMKGDTAYSGGFTFWFGPRVFGGLKMVMGAGWFSWVRR